MQKIKNTLEILYINECIIDYDIFQNTKEIEVEIKIKNPSELKFKKIIEKIGDEITDKAIDYDFNKNNEWQTFYLIN